MRVLVTGGTGFVGSHVVRTVREAGHDIRLLVRTPAKVAPLMERMRVDPDPIEVVAGDITDAASVAEAVAGCDAVVHSAAVVGTDPSAEAEMERVNLAGVRNVVGAAAAAGCDPIVHVSSVAALFPFETDPVTAEHPLRGDHNAYGRTKAACDRFCRELQADGAPVVIFYPSGILGPDDWTGSTQIEMWKTLLNVFPVARGYAGSWIDVRDLAAMITATLRPGSGPDRLLAMGSFLTAHEQRDILERACGRRIRSVPLPRPLWWTWGRLGDVARRYGRDLVFTSDAFDYVFHSTPGDDSATIAATGVAGRPVVETFADTVRWLVEAGHVPPERGVVDP